jgi:uncharacterized protein
LRGISWFIAFVACVLGFTSSRAHADLYAADAAYRAKEFPRAFELFRELAELGHAESQETLAIMYVQGEGVARNNILGYSWAVLALEQRPSEAAQSIVDQIGPHLNEAGRGTAEELRGKYGKDALKKTILRTERTPFATKKVPCTMKVPANPDDYFPPDAIKKGISGLALINARVFSDGRDHDPRPARLYPAQPFDEPAMLVSMNNVYAPQVENGVAQPCTMRFKVKFWVGRGRSTKPVEQDLSALRKKAMDGDPDAQLLYGILLPDSDPPPTGENSLEWILKAAQAGKPVAQYLAGREQLTSYGSEVNEAQGLFWLDKAARAGDNDARLELAYHYLKDAANPVNARTAADLLERALEAGRPEARFYLAALLASNPDDVLRDPQRALELFGKDQGIYDRNPIGWEIRAAAQANLGDFDEAAKLEKRAIRMAKSFKWNTAPLDARLATYEAKKPWVGDLLAFY